MKIKLYLNDWFYNMGLVGLMRIFDFAKIDYLAKDNYLEFDLNNLEGLQYKYFEYFIEQYDFEKMYINKFKQYISEFKKLENIEKAYKESNEFIKKLSKDISGTSMSAEFEELKKEYGEYRKTILEDVESACETLNKISQLINIDEIKLKFGLSYMRGILYNNYFGQVSFLQKSMKNKGIDEHADIMYRDYIYPIFADLEFERLLRAGNADFAHFINDIREKLKSDRFNIYRKAVKESKGNVEKIKKIRESYIECSICGNFKSIDQDFYEGVFSPLGVSNDNAQNFFWDFNNKFPICDVCKLVLLFAPVGATMIYNYIIGKEFQVFVNLDTDINTLYKINQTFKSETDSDNPYKELILDVVSQYREKAEWTLKNILFVEFRAEYENKKCNLYYFNIPKYLAHFLKQYSERTLSYISNKSFKDTLIDSILKHRSLDRDIYIRLKTIIKKGGRGRDVYYAVMAKCLLNMCKKDIRGDHMVYHKIKKAYDSGAEIYNYYKNLKQENKINSIAYRILNAAKIGNKKELMDTLLRLFINANKKIPIEFLDIFNQREVDAESIAQAFVAGLTSSQKVETQENNEQSDVEEAEVDE